MRSPLSILFITVVVAIIAIVAVSCGGGGSATSVCDPGVVQACPCGDGLPDGTQVCNADGTAWGDCDCASGDTDVDTDVDSDTDADTDADTDTDSDAVCPYDCMDAIVCSSLGVAHEEYTCPDADDVCCEENGPDTDTESDTECALTCQEHAYQCVTSTVTVGSCPAETPFCCEPASTDTDTDTDSDTDTDTDTDTDADACPYDCTFAFLCDTPEEGTVYSGYTCATSGFICCDLAGVDTEPDPCPEADPDYTCLWAGECTSSFPYVGVPDDSYYCAAVGTVCCHLF